MSVAAFRIMQEPGPQAYRRRQRLGLDAPWHSRPDPKRVAVVEATGQKDALGEFVHWRYLETGNRQYAGHRFEWRGERGLKWRPDDGADPGTRGREWSVVVTLRNGEVNVHETRFLAWRHDGRWDRRPRHGDRIADAAVAGIAARRLGSLR